MKRKITKDEIIERLKLIDTRFKKFNETNFNYILDNGFAELIAMVQPFTKTQYEDLAPYYENGETTISINMPDDVSAIYDMYLLLTNQDESIYDHGEIRERDINRIYQNNDNNSIVHIDLSYDKNDRIYESAVIKYFFIPNHEFEDLFLGSDVYSALESAFIIAAYRLVNDFDRAKVQEEIFIKRSQAIVDIYPAEFEDTGKPNMFPIGV